MIKGTWILALVGLFVGCIGALLIWRNMPLLSRSMISVSDDWMLSNRGPQLGMRSADPEIVLVQYGEPSAVRLGTPPTPETDSKLYRRLLDAGATVVMDGRAKACGTAEAYDAELRPYVEAITQHQDAKGRVARDLIFSPNMDPGFVGPILPYVRHNAVNLMTPQAPLLHSRVYPIAYRDFFELTETAAPWIVRRHREQQAATAEEIETQLIESDLMDSWLLQFPTMSQLLEQEPVDPESPPEIEPEPYDLNGTPIHWLPFLSTYQVVSPGGFWIDYSVDTADYPQLEYGDVVENDFDADIVKGKIVLIGLAIDFVPATERFTPPHRFEQASESEVLAAAVQTLLDGRTLRELPTWLIAVLTVLGCIVAAIAVGIRNIWLAVVAVIAVFALYYAGAIIAYRNCWFTDLVWAPIALLSSTTVSSGYRFFSEVRSRRRITDMFGRYVPRAVVDQLVLRPELQEIMLSGSKREVTVMFADIRGFTTYSEQHPPETVLEKLNEILKVMVDCTFAEFGTVDKFIGDAILVLFNAPTEQEDHVQRAIRTAWAIQSKLAEREGGLAVGIGIHSGEAVVGNVGTSQRMEYTAIGSTVNLASRLCDKADRGEIMCTDEVASKCEDSFRFDSLEPIQVKGISHDILVKRVSGPVVSEAEASEE